MLVSRKDGTVNFTRKGEQELQRPGSTTTGLRRVRNISPQRDRKGIPRKEKCHTKRYKQTQKNSTSFKQHLHHPTTWGNDPPPSLWDLLQVYFITIRPFITINFSVTYTVGTVRLEEDIVN